MYTDGQLGVVGYRSAITAIRCVASCPKRPHGTVFHDELTIIRSNDASRDRTRSAKIPKQHWPQVDLSTMGISKKKKYGGKN
jgi:hypothetical protein